MNNLKNEEIKPCPFCGDNPITEENYVPELTSDRYVVRCKRCLVAVGHFESMIKAIEWWNTRSPTSTEPKQELDLIKLGLVVADAYTPHETESISDHCRRIAKAVFDKFTPRKSLPSVERIEDSVNKFIMFDYRDNEGEAIPVPMQEFMRAYPDFTRALSQAIHDELKKGGE